GVTMDKKPDRPAIDISVAAKNVIAAREARIEHARRRSGSRISFKPMILERAKNSQEPRVTLMIPTCNRNYFLGRQLDYLDRNFDRAFFDIIVLDGSTKQDSITENQRLSSKYNITYKWYDSETVTGYDRFIDTLSHLKTD